MPTSSITGLKPLRSIANYTAENACYLQVLDVVFGVRRFANLTDLGSRATPSHGRAFAVRQAADRVMAGFCL